MSQTKGTTVNRNLSCPSSHLLIRLSHWPATSASKSQKKSSSFGVLGTGTWPAQLSRRSNLTFGRLPTVYLLASPPSPRSRHNGVEERTVKSSVICPRVATTYRDNPSTLCSVTDGIDMVLNSPFANENELAERMDEAFRKPQYSTGVGWMLVMDTLIYKVSQCVNHSTTHASRCARGARASAETWGNRSECAKRPSDCFMGAKDVPGRVSRVYITVLYAGFRPSSYRTCVLLFVW